MMDLSLQPALGAVAGATLLFLTWRSLSKRNESPRLPLPPGPKRKAIVGNLHDRPKKRPWLTYASWAKIYGDVFSMTIFGKNVVILNSAKAANDLFVQRSTKYSSRPHSPMLHDLMRFDFAFTLMPYGPAWRERRRAFHPFVHTTAITRWEPAQAECAHALLRKLLDNPTEWMKHLTGMFGIFSTQMLFGITDEKQRNELVDLADEGMTLFSQANVPGAQLVDVLPFLKYVPAWFPGAGFQKRAARARYVSTEVLNRPFAVVKQHIANGDLRECMVTEMLTSAPHDADRAEYELMVKHIAGTVYPAGADSSGIIMTLFFLAMIFHPEAQKKAQAEIDAVIGIDRLPTFADRPNLPYVNALISELLRWRVVAPLGGPHFSTEDDVYEGYLIPAGTIVIGNVWAILHDPEAYPDPEAFKPERFLRKSATGELELDPTVRDPRIAAFGFGRRICPGRHIAEQALYAVVTSVLAAFDVTAPKDASGKPVLPEIEMTTELFSHPSPFECVVTPRSARTAEIIRGLNVREGW